MERIEEDGGSSFQEYELPTAVITFKQAFGRLIRRAATTGFSCVWISGSSHAVTAGRKATYRKVGSPTSPLSLGAAG